jgi:hypothetical protein
MSLLSPRDIEIYNSTIYIEKLVINRSESDNKDQKNFSIKNFIGQLFLELMSEIRNKLISKIDWLN